MLDTASECLQHVLAHTDVWMRVFPHHKEAVDVDAAASSESGSDPTIS
jgi:hypothetical protein